MSFLEDRVLKEAAEAARDLVAAGADVALDYRDRITAREKDDGTGLVTEANRALDEQIVAALRERFPQDEILSEESPPDLDLAASRIWCVDPLDGTKEYVEGRPEYAVMAGLLVEKQPAAGAFALPALGAVFWGWRGGGAFCTQDGETRALRLNALEKLEDATMIHSRRKRDLFAKLGAELGVRNQVPAGGVGYKVGQILLGTAHLYVDPRAGPRWWDSVAPGAVLLGAGGELGSGDGSALVYHREIIHTSGLLFSVPGLRAPAAARLSP